MNSIFALCSPYGKSGVAIFRISGPAALDSLKQLINQPKIEPLPRQLYLRKIYHPKTGSLIDEAMVVYFSAQASFTGHEVVEIHTHGSLAVLNIMNEALAQLPNLRLAEPGEFARQAFLNQKMDLTAAEGLADLIEAETEYQHLQAMQQFQGGLAQLYEQWRQVILTNISHIEAYIDFPDEDIPTDLTKVIEYNIAELKQAIAKHLSDNQRGERLRNGLKLTIAGRPNVGKSSLLNYLMQRQIAIVSPIAGTTRDVIEGHLDIGGYPIILQDTAGLHEDTTDFIEQEGIKLAKVKLHEADIKILMLDSSNAMDMQNSFYQQLANENLDKIIIVFNKVDLAVPDLNQYNWLPAAASYVTISVKENKNLDTLIQRIADVANKLAGPSSTPQLSRLRHRAELENAQASLNNFTLTHDLVLAAEDLRSAAAAIGRLTGKITVDEILGEIFSNFCIGK